MTRKTERLEIRVTPEQKHLFERATAVSGQSLSSFAVSTLVERAQQVIGAWEQTTLSRHDWEVFVTALQEERPAPALRRAVRRDRRERDA